MRPSIFAAGLLSSALLAGCAQAPEPVAAPIVTPTQIADTTPPRYSARMGWIGARRGGAAVRGEGYEHVIAMDPAYTVSPLGMDLGTTSADPTGDLDLNRILASVRGIDSGTGKPAIQAVELAPPKAGRPAKEVRPNTRGQPLDLTARRGNPQASAALPEDRRLLAWKRFCEGARNMTAEDWTVIHNTSGPPYNTLEEKRHSGCAAMRNDFVNAKERAAAPVSVGTF